MLLKFILCLLTHTYTHTGFSIAVIDFVVSSLCLFCFASSLPSPPSLLTSVSSPGIHFIFYSVRSPPPPCYDNGSELSMFNEWLEAGYRFRNIPVTVNMRSSSIICSHIAVYSERSPGTEAQIYFGRSVLSFAHNVRIVQMWVSPE